MCASVCQDPHADSSVMRQRYPESRGQDSSQTRPFRLTTNRQHGWRNCCFKYNSRDYQVSLQYKWNTKESCWASPPSSLGDLAPLILQLQKKYTHINIFFSLFLLQIQMISLHNRLLPVKTQLKQHQVCIPIWPLHFYSPNNVSGARKLSALNPVG